MGGIKPDTSVYALDRSQPEFNEKLWQYLNRRVSDWRITEGKEKAKEHAAAARAHRERLRRRAARSWSGCGASNWPSAIRSCRRTTCGRCIPALAALAWGEPRRRSYWEQELLNALVIVERGWSTPQEMRGSWAGAMGHTQWMPEVWLNIGCRL